jgi:acyl carrier protein
LGVDKAVHRFATEPNYIIGSQRRRRRRAVRAPSVNPHFGSGVCVDTRDEVLAVLDDVLSLKGRTGGFRDDTPLLGSLPELDSMAVANVLASLEQRFGIVIDDDDIDASTFASLGSLVGYVRSKLEPRV